MYIALCGHKDEKENSIVGKITCQIVGCENCKYFNGRKFYVANIQKGLAEWAKKELRKSGKTYR